MEAGGNNRLDCVYIFADGDGGMAILNAESHKQAFETLLSYPLYPFFQWEVKPLCDWSPMFMVIEGALRGGG